MQKKDATLEKVRATAGNIARDVSAQKVETAVIEEENLTNALPSWIKMLS